MILVGQSSGVASSKYQEIYKKTKEHVVNSKKEQLVLYADAA